jgi:hypothetical protein
MGEYPLAALSMIAYGITGLQARRTGLLVNRRPWASRHRLAALQVVFSFNPCKQVGALLIPDPCWSDRWHQHWAGHQWRRHPEAAPARVRCPLTGGSRATDVEHFAGTRIGVLVTPRAWCAIGQDSLCAPSSGSSAQIRLHQTTSTCSPLRILYGPRYAQKGSHLVPSPWFPGSCANPCRRYWGMGPELVGMQRRRTAAVARPRCSCPHPAPH